MSEQDLRARTQRILVQQLQSLQRSGVDVVARPPAVEAGHSKGKVAAAKAAPSEAPPAGSAPGSPDTGRKRQLLAELSQEVAGCTMCRELAESRTQTVFGVGNVDARLCFVGEAPGADEDRQGEPFVGRAGRLLTDIIERGMGLNRSDVYILNTLKCRPPGNRTPSAEEVDYCRHFFESQLDIIQPEFLCCLGAVAAQSVLETRSSIGQLRGRFFDYGSVRVICTYHPAYLLRNPAAKKSTWQDIQLLMEAMGLPLPSRSSES